MPPKPDPSRYRKIVLLRTDRIGDMLVTSPCIRALRQALPSARIDLVASPLNVVAVHHNPYIDQIHLFHLHRPWTWPALIWRLRRNAYDAAFVFNSNSGSTAWLCSALKVPESIGFNGPPQRGASPYTWLPEPSPSPHAVLGMLQKMESLGVPAVSPDMDFFLPPAVTAAMETRFPFQPGRLRLGIFVGNIKKIHNRWPVEKFRELTVRLLDSEPDLDIVLLAGPQDRPLLRSFSDLDNPRLSRFVGDTFQETGGVLRQCHGLLGGSSGPSHAAAALGVPVLSTITQYNTMVWAPLGEHHDYVTPDTDILDIRGIPVETVEGMVKAFLQKTRKARATPPHQSSPGHVL